MNNDPQASVEGYHKKRRRLLKERVFQKLGAICARCGFTDIRALQIDHIKGNGKQDREKRGGNLLYHVLKDEKDMYQILCANCNWIKRAEQGEEGLRWPKGYQAKQLATEAQTIGTGHGGDRKARDIKRYE
jgi:hypothetical protein